MKKIKTVFVIVLALLLIVTTLCACGDKDTIQVQEPDIVKIRSICDLATLKCYFHNVAKSTKEPESGLLHTFDKALDFWIEYDGYVELGINMNDVAMEVSGDQITITLPKAEVLGVSVNRESYNSDSYYAEDSGFLNGNKITAEDTTNAVKVAQEEMERTAKENESLLQAAQDRAKMLIENYIAQIGDVMGSQYTIKWKYL